MRLIVGCEYSGVVRRAFRALGHDAWSCDLLPSEDNSPFHIQGDVLEIIGENWDAGIFHPLHVSDSRAVRLVKERSRTYEGIANAMAKQWGCL